MIGKTLGHYQITELGLQEALENDAMRQTVCAADNEPMHLVGQRGMPHADSTAMVQGSSRTSCSGRDGAVFQRSVSVAGCTKNGGNARNAQPPEESI